jgi:hypothetical protein
MIRQRGMASLTLVLIVVTIISLIMVPIQLISYIRNNQAVRFAHSQYAFFAAEGAYAETVTRLKKHESWGKNFTLFPETYHIGPNEITRMITWKSTDNKFEIDILANNRIAQRRITGEFTPAVTTSSSPPIDIVIVLDYSYSMIENCSSPNCPLDILKQATLNLVDTLKTNPNIRLGAVKFSSSSLNDTNIPLGKRTPATKTQLLGTNDETIWQQFINNVPEGGSSYIYPYGTNISAGLYAAKEEFDTNPNSDPSAEKVMIFFSDGVPQSGINNASYPDTLKCDANSDEPCNCDGNECATEASSINAGYKRLDGANNKILYTPFNWNSSISAIDHYGSFCTDQAITIATDMRNITEPATIYSVFLNNAPKAACAPNPYEVNPGSVYTDKVLKLGRLTTFSISNEGNDPDKVKDFDPSAPTAAGIYQYYFEASHISQLTGIFDGLGSTLSTPGSAAYGETIPD